MGCLFEVVEGVERWRAGVDEDEGVDWAGDEGELICVCQGVDVDELEFW